MEKTNEIAVLFTECTIKTLESMISLVRDSTISEEAKEEIIRGMNSWKEDYLRNRTSIEI